MFYLLSVKVPARRYPPPGAPHAAQKGRLYNLQDIAADGAFHRRAQRTLAEAERPVPSGDEDDRRGGAVLEAVDLMRELRGKVLLQIEDGVFALRRR